MVKHSGGPPRHGGRRMATFPRWPRRHGRSCRSARSVAPGTIVIRTASAGFTSSAATARPSATAVAVGRPAKQWFGEARVDGKYVKPAWAPPAEVKARQSEAAGRDPRRRAQQPDGRAALTLDRDEYAIHGTNRPSSIGTFVSYGCIRMLNEDIVDLYDQVSVGTPVVVTR